VIESNYRKDVVVTYVLMLFLGIFGVHRFYNGMYITGILYVMTGAFCGLGLFFDVFYIPTMVKSGNNS